MEDTVQVRGRTLSIPSWEAETLVHAAVCTVLLRATVLLYVASFLTGVPSLPPRYSVLTATSEERRFLALLGATWLVLAFGATARRAFARWGLVVLEVAFWFAVTAFLAWGPSAAPSWRQPSFLEWALWKARGLDHQVLFVLAFLGLQGVVIVVPLLCRGARHAFDRASRGAPLAPIWPAESPVVFSVSRWIALSLVAGIAVVEGLLLFCCGGLLTET